MPAHSPAPPSEFDPAAPSCCVCGSQKLRAFDARASDTPDRRPVHIVECRGCGFAWQHPLGRSNRESVTHFQASYGEEGKARSDYFDPAVKVAISELELEFVESCRPVSDTRRQDSGGRLLDVGAGAGIFAGVAAGRGWDVTAVDPALDPHPAEGARSAQGARVRAIVGTLADVPPGETFDVVTLWDVLEHAEAPVSLLVAAKAFVRPGGWIVVETGNYPSAERIGDGLDSWMFQLDHRWYFSPDAVAGLLQSIGFTDLTFAPRVLRPRWTGTAAYAGPSLRRLAKAVIRRPWRVVEHVRRHLALRSARRRPLAGLGIFCVAARAGGGTGTSS